MHALLATFIEGYPQSSQSPYVEVGQSSVAQLALEGTPMMSHKKVLKYHVFCSLKEIQIILKGQRELVSKLSSLARKLKLYHQVTKT